MDSEEIMSCDDCFLVGFTYYILNCFGIFVLVVMAILFHREGSAPSQHR